MADSIVGTSNIWPYYSSGNVPPSGNQSGDVMGKDQFLTILVTQLRNQDPMQPMQDREFIAQMAQFSSLEQMINMTEQIQMLRNSLGISSSLIGKEIAWNVYGPDGSLAGADSGVVDSILLKEGVQYAMVGAMEIDLNEVIQIAAGATVESSEETGAEANMEASEEAP